MQDLELSQGCAYPDNPCQIPEYGSVWILLQRQENGKVVRVYRHGGLNVRAEVDGMCPYMRGIHKISLEDVRGCMSQKELMAKIVQDAQRARQRAAAYIRSELKLECLELPPVVRLGYNSDAADHPQLYQVMTDVGLDFVAAMEASGTVGFIDLYKVMRKIDWGYGGAPAERRGTDKRGAIPPVSLSLGPLAELLLKMDARLHHCAYYDALMAARIATSLGYVMAAMFPPSNRSVVTHARQMVGKVRWWRHVRAEWVAAATNTAWERWRATY